MPGHSDSIAHLDRTRASSVLGYPRIGPHRELKRALESYWHGDSPAAELLATGRQIQESTWLELKAMGLVNSYAGALVPWLAGIFGIFLVRQYCLSIPDEMLEAARIDGAR